MLLFCVVRSFFLCRHLPFFLFCPCHFSRFPLCLCSVSLARRPRLSWLLGSLFFLFFFSLSLLVPRVLCFLLLFRGGTKGKGMGRRERKKKEKRKGKKKKKKEVTTTATRTTPMGKKTCSAHVLASKDIGRHSNDIVFIIIIFSATSCLCRRISSAKVTEGSREGQVVSFARLGCCWEGQPNRQVYMGVFCFVFCFICLCFCLHFYVFILLLIC